MRFPPSSPLRPDSLLPLPAAWFECTNADSQGGVREAERGATRRLLPAQAALPLCKTTRERPTSPGAFTLVTGDNEVAAD